MSQLLALPPQLLEAILLRLSTKDLLRIACVCKYMSAICGQDSLWLRKYLHGHPKRVEYQGSWKATAASADGAPEAIVASCCQPRHSDQLCSTYHQRMLFCCHWRPDSAVNISGGPAVEVCEAESGDEIQPGIAHLPQICTGLMKYWPTDRWRSAAFWKPLLATEFRVAKPHGGSCMMALSTYLKYAALQQDEDPLYIFDEAFGTRAPALAEAYSVPKNTPADLFEVLGEGRPDFRWLVMGPVRSGSAWHQDPSGTCAWNALIAGHKRWLFYPPHVTPPGVQLTTSDSGDHDVISPSPVRWILEVLPSLPPDLRPHEHLQKPGEIVFLPSRWWHCILNIGDTIAVTQNYVPSHGLEAAVRDLAGGTTEHSETGGESLQGNGDTALENGTKGSHTARVHTTGFARSRRLGTWLGALAQKQPSLAPRVVDLAEKYAAFSSWESALTQICCRLGLPVPATSQRFPLSGGPSVVFRISDDVILKFYTKEPPMDILDAAAEQVALHSIGRSKQLSRPMYPRIIGTHRPEPNSDPELDVRALDASLPWTAMTACRGTALGRLGEIPVGLAAAIGTALAMLHSLPPPGEAETSCIPQQPEDSLAIHEASLVNGHGSSPHSGRVRKEADGLWLPGRWWFKDEDTWRASVLEVQQLPSSADPWEPFLGFLQRSRMDVRARCHAEAALPLPLVEELDSYLPEDVKVLCPDLRCALPRLLHGDLSPGNILTEAMHATEAGSHSLAAEDPSVSFIDFGDSGYGDPLFDIPPLHLLTLRGNDRLTSACLEAYCNVSAGMRTLLSKESDLQPSYRAMCYTLLHDQDILSTVFDRRPELWEASSLEELQRELWGFLDQLETG